LPPTPLVWKCRILRRGTRKWETLFVEATPVASDSSPEGVTDEKFGEKTKVWELAARHVGDSIFQIEKWPFCVHVADGARAEADFSSQSWGELYPTLHSAQTEEFPCTDQHQNVERQGGSGNGGTTGGNPSQPAIQSRGTVAGRTIIAKLAILPGSFAVLTYFVAICWWNLWMYRGWKGAPRIVTPILQRFMLVDGEAAYDCEFWDMAMTALVGLSCLFLLAAAVRKGLLRR